MGNNYESAIIVARNAIKDYPYSKYKEDLELLVLKSRFQEADLSVDERKADRFREVIDEYYSFINNYPDSPNLNEAENIFKIASKYVHDWSLIYRFYNNPKYQNLITKNHGLQEKQCPS